MQKSIEFHLPHLEILHLSPHYPLGLFSTSKSTSTSDQSTNSFLDPLGLFSTPVSENLDDYEYYYLYDDYSDIKLVMWLDFQKEWLGW